MANQQHIDIVIAGGEAINKWRAEHPDKILDLTRANLAEADLTEANLTEANLTRANLTRANLTGANLTRANLAEANLTEANLTEANLMRANLRWADLTEANLTRANLRWANLAEANLTRANLTEANLTGANLRWANLTRANLTEANLMDGILWSQYLADVVPALLAAGGHTVEDVAQHWDCHSWDNCPMSAAFDCHDLFEVPVLLRPRAAEFIQFFDAGLIPNPLGSKDAIAS